MRRQQNGTKRNVTSDKGNQSPDTDDTSISSETNIKSGKKRKHSVTDQVIAAVARRISISGRGNDTARDEDAIIIQTGSATSIYITGEDRNNGMDGAETRKTKTAAKNGNITNREECLEPEKPKKGKMRSDFFTINLKLTDIYFNQVCFAFCINLVSPHDSKKYMYLILPPAKSVH